MLLFARSPEHLRNTVRFPINIVCGGVNILCKDSTLNMDEGGSVEIENRALKYIKEAGTYEYYYEQDCLRINLMIKLINISSLMVLSFETCHVCSVDLWMGDLQFFKYYSPKGKEHE